MFHDEFYPTPVALINQMLEGVKLSKIQTILEPSAGKGDILDVLQEKIKSSSDSWYYRKQELDIDAIEIDPNLCHILKGKEYRVVHDDFLTYKTFKAYDLIILNPPFSNGDKHLLKALEMQKNGGMVICILNAETLRTTFSNTRKDVVRKLEEYNAEITYIQGAFSNAERKSDVEIAVIKVTIPDSKKESEILKGLKREEQYEAVNQEPNQLTQSDFFQNIVEQYNYEVKAGVRFINEYFAIRPHMLDSFKEERKECIIHITIGDKKIDNPHEAVNRFVRVVRYKYWTTLFHSDVFNRLMTSELRTRYYNKIAELSDYDFSLYNIEQIKKEINSLLCKSVEDTIIALFDEFSHQYHWTNETSKNIHYYNGWKTNKAWIINKKVIRPYMNAFNSFSKRFNCTDYSLKQKLFDMEKVFNYLDGGNTSDHLELAHILQEAERCEITRKIETKYFYLTFFRKGTCHIQFKDMELLAKFNIFGSQRKGWLPPCYGKTQYKDMTAEEKAVIDEFQGEKEYEKVVANADYYLFKSSEALLLLAS